MFLVIAFGIVFVAGCLRGMTGFGYALVAALGLGFLQAPAVTTPVVLVIELAITLAMIRDGTLAHAEPRRLVPLVAGGLAGTLVGAFAVAALPAAWVKPGLDLAIFLSAVAALLHFHAPQLDRPWIAAAVGTLVGIMAAAFAVGGPFVVVWHLAIGAPPVRIRANLVVFFGAVDVAAVALRAAITGISGEVLTQALLLMPASILGVVVGTRLFRYVDPLWWRRVVAVAIAGGAVVGLARSLLAAP